MGIRTKARKRNEPYHFMWVDGSCQTEFVESFGVQATSFPTVVAFSPSKKLYAQLIGVYGEASTLSFLQGVKTGRGVSKLSTTPSLKDLDCKAAAAEREAELSQLELDASNNDEEDDED